MKNKNLWLSLLIFIGVMFLLTWVIPSTSYNDSGALVLGNIKPTGIWDVFYYLSMLPAWFGQNFIFVLIVGVFYGVINKTGALRSLVERVSAYFKKREKLFLLISSSSFILIAGLTGIDFPLLVFVPLFMAIILKMGYSKITALVATIGSILVGIMGSLYSVTLFSAIASYVDAGITYGWYKFGLIVVGLLITELYLYFKADILKGKNKVELNEEMLFIEKEEGSKTQKIWPLVTTFILILVFYILGLTPWSNMYSFAGFENFHNSLMEVHIGNFAVFKSFLGNSLASLGTWTIADACSIILIFAAVLVLAYKVKWEEAYKGIISGLTKMLPTAMLVLVASLAFVIVSQSGALNTVIKVLAEITEGINVFTYSLASFIGAALVNDVYITSYITGILSTVLGESANMPLLILIQQVMYGLAMLTVPTSVILLAGLSYLEVGYTEWLKNIWKFLLILAAASILILVLAVVL